MTEIVDHLHPPGLPAEFLPPGDPGKSLKGVVDFCLRHIVKPRCHRSHRSVVHIKFAYERNLERLISKLKSGTFSRGGNITDSLRAILRETHFNHLCKTISCDLNAISIVAIHQHHAVARNDVEQTPKAELDLIEVVEDIRVIKLDVVYDQQLRQVMNKFRTLVEKG